MKNEHQILLDTYVDGRLDPAQKAEFDQLYQTDEAFKREVDIHHAIMSGFDTLHVEALENKMNQWESSFESNDTNEAGQTDHKVVSITSAKRTPRRWMSIAAAIAILLMTPIVYNAMFSPNFDSYLAETTPQAMLLDVSRSSGEDDMLLKDMKKEGYNFFNEGQYEKAKSTLTVYMTKMSELNKTDDHALYILGMAKIYLKEYHGAVQDLGKVLNTRDGENAAWMWSLAQYKLGKKEEAKAMFLKIGADSAHSHSLDAKRFLRDFY